MLVSTFDLALRRLPILSFRERTLLKLIDVLLRLLIAKIDVKRLVLDDLVRSWDPNGLGGFAQGVWQPRAPLPWHVLFALE